MFKIIEHLTATAINYLKFLSQVKETLCMRLHVISVLWKVSRCLYGEDRFLSKRKNSPNVKRAEVIGMGMDMKLYHWQFNQNKR